jgi:hypothetical protein
MKNKHTQKFISNNGHHKISDPQYFEWWYFDVITSDDIMIIIEFHASNLANRDNIPMFILSVYYPGGKVVKRHEILKPNMTKISKEKCDIRYFENQIVENENQIFIKWNVSGILLDLVYQKQSWLFNTDNVQLIKDPESNRSFNWLIPANRSAVHGTMVIENEAYDIKGAGYHDHNWGNLKLKKCINEWTWGRILTKDYSIVFADIEQKNDESKKNVRSIFFENTGHLIFKGNEYGLSKISVPIYNSKSVTNLFAHIHFGSGSHETKLSFSNFRQIDVLKFLDPACTNRSIRKCLIIFYFLGTKSKVTSMIIDKILHESAYYRFTADYKLFHEGRNVGYGKVLFEQMRFVS